jgi:lysozyme
MLRGIDVSHWQGAFPWGTAHGYDFMIARASVGLAHDETFAANVAGARGQGLLPGAYHFLEPGDGAAQADVFADAIGHADGLLTALDLEAGGLTLAEALAFRAQFRTRTADHPLFVYGSLGFLARLGITADFGPLWLAHWVASAGDPIPPGYWRVAFGGYTRADILQFGSDPRLHVDGDASMDTAAQLAAFTAAPGGDMGLQLTLADTTPEGTLLLPVGAIVKLVASGADYRIGHEFTTEVGTVVRLTGGTEAGYLVAIAPTAAGPELAYVKSTTPGAVFKRIDPPPPPVPDCSAPVAAAVAPLEATIATQVATIADREDRLHRSSVITTI